MKKNTKIILVLALVVLLFLAWAPWMDNKAIHDKVFEERARIDGTMGWIIQPDGTKEYHLNLRL